MSVLDLVCVCVYMGVYMCVCVCLCVLGSVTVRYDHMSVLCELLPVGLPSLASCLQTLHHGRFCPDAQARATHSLGTHSVEAEAMTG